MKIKIHFNREENVKHYDTELTEIDLEEYIWGVIGAEIGNSPIEACKALAIAARTNAMPYIDKDKTISDTSPQAFRSSRLTNNYNNAKDAAEETKGCVLFYNGKLANPASYSSSNGGRTTSSKERWGSARAWLIEQDDPWDYGKKTGHGVGMSQRGCQQMAKAGKTHEEILSFYYPNTYIFNVEGVSTVANYDTVNASYLVEKFTYMVNKKWKYEAGAAREGYVDCSGAFTYWYKQANSFMYHGSNTMYRKYSTENGKIGEINLVPGMAVYKHKNDGKEPTQYKNDGIGNMHHVGLYLGNGMVAEAKGTKWGCVFSDVNEWDYASRLKYTNYDVYESSSDPVEPQKGVVNTQSGSLNMRTSPTTSASIITTIPKGTEVLIYDESNGWYKVEYKGKTGWVSGKYILIENKPKITYCITAYTDDENIYKDVQDYLNTLNVSFSCSTTEGA